MQRTDSTECKVLTELNTQNKGTVYTAGNVRIRRQTWSAQRSRNCMGLYATETVNYEIGNPNKTEMCITFN